MTVRVYSTPTCPYCKMAKSYLDDRGISYDDLDVSADVNARDKYGKTPLHKAALRDNKEIVELLRRHGAKE